MLSNDVSADVCEALLLTPKARVIAPLRVWRRGEGDFLLLTEPELGETVRAALLRARFAAKCEIELEALRIAAGTPRFGREIDDRVMPAEAGLVGRAVSLTKGCFPGQEPIARLHYRGHANRGLRVLAIDGAELPGYDAELTFEGKPVGRVTSAARDGDRIVALAYVRVEVPADAVLDVGTAKARPLDSVPTRP